MKTKPKARRGIWLKRAVTALIVAALIFVIGGVVAHYVYNQNLKPVSSTQKIMIVKIPLGSSLDEIGKIFKDAGVIKSEWAFKQYVRNQGADNDIKAGTYELSPGYSVQEIVSIITEGKIKTNLVTILPGQTVKQIKETFINHGFSKSEVDSAFQADNYKNHPALVDKPVSADLEGYLYPESYQKDDNTSAKDIITLALDEMQQRLTPDVRTALAKQDLSVYEGIVLASIITKEVDKPSDQAQAAQVFLKRLRSDMLLGSDVTAYYGAQKAGHPRSLSYDSPYNTHLHKGLPKGPISNITDTALNAVVHPAKTDWLFFVAGDNGTTYFSRTLEEHKKLVEQYCKKLCAN